MISLSASACLSKGSSPSTWTSSTGSVAAAEVRVLAGPLRVAIECANDSLSRDDPYNDPVFSMQNIFERRGYEVTIVNGSNIDTVEKLSNYDVVVIGDSGFGGNDFYTFQSALKEWIQNGGGLVATGWTLYGIEYEGLVGGDLDQIVPVSPGYDFEQVGNTSMVSGEGTSIVQGVDPFPVYDYVEFPMSHVADSGATVLGYTMSTGNENVTTLMPMPAIVSWLYGLGRSVYLGPIYFADFASYDNEGLYEDVDAVRLLLNSIEWAANFASEPIRAECLTVSNQYSNSCALDFTIKIPDVDFAWMDVESVTPTYADLSAFDVVLLFEDEMFDNAPNVGSAVYDFVRAGGNLVIGTFYEQDRSDTTGLTPFGWGPLETIDPFTSDGIGCEYSYDELNASSIVAHPITLGVGSLWCTEFHGGVHAKADTIVVANWTGPNDLGEACPLAGYRVLEDNQRVVQISIYPNYYYYDPVGTEFGGDFYRLWDNAIVCASQALYTGPQILKELTQVSTGSVEEAPSIALDNNGNLHMVWIGNDTANLYYMMVNADGIVLINETCLDPSLNASSNHVRRASIGIDSSNNVHIVFHAQNIYEPWPEYTNCTGLYQQETIYLKISPYLDDMDGSSANSQDITVVPETVISTQDSSKSRAANLAVDSADRVHVVWFDNDTWLSTGQGELHYLVMDGNGGILVPETNVTAGFYTDVDWGEPEIVVDSNGNAHVFFVTIDWNVTSGNWRDIWYTMIDGDTGTVLIDDTQLTNSSETWKYARPFVDIDPENRIHIVWHDSRFMANGTGQEEIFYMEIDPYLDDRSGDAADPAALRVVDEMPVSENDGVKSYLANIATDGNGMSHVVWLNESSDNDNDIYYAMVDPFGNRLVTEYRVTHSVGMLDFGAWYSSSNRNPEIAVANGRVFIVDMAMNLSSSSYDVWLTILFVDETPPTTLMEFSSYNSAGKDWLSAGSMISLLAVDDESNVTATYCRIDGDTWQPYDQPFNLSSLTDGPHVIDYYSVDFFGNEENAKSQTVYLDSTAPQIDTPTRQPAGEILFGQAVVIAVNVTDPGSGVKQVFLHYTLNDGATWTDVEMDYNATSGLYEGTIPAQAYSVTVKYSVSAGDNVDNNAIRDNSELYYSYPVIPEFSPVILTATFALLSLSATVFAKKRAKKVI